MERNSMLCPHCRKLISCDERVCPYCCLPITGRSWGAKIIDGFHFANISPVQAILAITILYYIASLIVSILLANSLSLSFVISPSQEGLFHLGATGTIPIHFYGRYWSLISASFLHGGILHIIFNMMALWQIGDFVLFSYGQSRFLIIYIATGIIGFYISLLCGVSFTIGASASICGLIGATLYYGKARGGFYGEMIYKQAVGWVIGLVVFGFIFPGINNWAHGGGLISGIAIAFLLGFNERKQEMAWHKKLSFLLVIITAVTLLWALVSALIACLHLLTS
ncbi:MAG: rhomboid family intramembrane serine protease [Deltaproteobacteria bacterium]